MSMTGNILKAITESVVKILEADSKHLVVVFKEGIPIQKEVENDGSSKQR
jgi:phenylpyruvate tautomerase PptA (4-oxalocrotonate tautomerase family)